MYWANGGGGCVLGLGGYVCALGPGEEVCVLRPMCVGARRHITAQLCTV